jgi:ankyrin repeat protein
MKSARVFSLAVAVLLATAGVASADALLSDAAKQQDKVAVQTLLKQHADVNAAQPDGSTALHWAAHWNDLAEVEQLIAAGANVNAKNDYSVTPLSLACTNGSVPMVQRLLKAGANPNMATLTGETPLMTSVRVGNLAVATALLAGGANINAAGGGRDQTALMWAVVGQRHDFVKLFLAKGADIHLRSRLRPEYVSFGRGDPQGGRISGKADGTLTFDGTRPGLGWINKGGMTAFLFACQRDELESAKMLVAAGADINETTPEGSTALMIALQNDASEVAAYLIDKGADPNKSTTGYTALHLAVAERRPELVQALLKHGANPNVPLTKGSPTIEGASSQAQLPEYLLGATPFLLAAALDDALSMKLLVTAGADPKASMVDGTTPLMATMGIDPGIRGMSSFRKVGYDRGYGEGGYARRGTETEGEILAAAKLTVELGNDVNAVRTKQPVYHGANARTLIGRDEGDTALHTAIADHLPALVEFLVKQGASLDAMDKHGLTPLALSMTKLKQYTTDGQAPPIGDKNIEAKLRELGATR